MPEACDARRAIVLLSGGLDSFTAAAMTKADGYEVYALSIRYGQIHAREIEAARRAARTLDVTRHLELAVDLAAFGGSALVGDGAIPKDRALESDHSIPSTYVPARNTVFLSLALAWAEVVSASAIVIGVNALDYSGYPDCRPEYLEAFERLAALATKAGVEGRPLAVLAPLLHLSKADIIRRGVALGLDYGVTHSCYDPTPSGAPCGRCDSCRLRARGFEEAGVPDPLVRTNGRERRVCRSNGPVSRATLPPPFESRKLDALFRGRHPRSARAARHWRGWRTPRPQRPRRL